MPRSPLACLPTFDPKSKALNAVIETPQGSRNKFKFKPECGVFELHFVLPAGSVFPYDFGYIPGTLGEDGDPLDVLILMDDPVFAGCVVPSRLVGVMEAEQLEDGTRERNDRLIAVALQTHEKREIDNLKDIDSELLKELAQFFTSYNAMRGKEFNLLAYKGPRQATKLLKQGMALAKKANG
jgi:inorganic pyrophosphatase